MYFEQLGTGLTEVFSWPAFPLMLVGIAIGFLVGLLPGLGGATVMALMLPFIFRLDPVPAFALLLGQLATTGTSGDLTSILFGIPGEGTSVAVIMDGHGMTKEGEAGRAVGASLMSSLVAGLMGAILLAVSIPVIRPLVLTFRSPELFAVALAGLAFVGMVSGGSRSKGLLIAMFGLSLAFIGLDSRTGIPRFTFGEIGLWSGVGIVPVIVGIFGLPELLELFARRERLSTVAPGKTTGIWLGVRDTFKYWGITLRTGALGSILGVIPGIGPATAQWVAYAHAGQSIKGPSKFGHGDVRGVIGASAANNASNGSALVPTVAFGVPGTSTMAIMLGAFLVFGLEPGPQMLTTNLHVTFSLVWTVVIATVVGVLISLVTVNHLVRLSTLRGSVLLPPLLLLLYLGSYAATNTMLSVIVALLAGLVGIVMVRVNWPRAPLVLGLVLGGLIENKFFLSLQAYGPGFIGRPVVMIAILVVTVVLFWPAIQALVLERKRKAKDAAAR